MKLFPIVLLVACSSPSSSPVDGQLEIPDGQLEVPPSAIRVLAVGDSLTLGAPELIGGWRAPLTMLAPELAFVGRQDSHGLHEGYSGQRIAQIRAHVLPALSELAPNVVLLMAGTNDITIGTSNDVILAELVQLAEDFNAAPGVERVLVGTIPFRAGVLREPTIAFNAAFVAAFVGTSAGIEPVDISGSLEFPTDFADSTHPNTQGYAKMATAWFKVL